MLNRSLVLAILAANLLVSCKAAPREPAEQVAFAQLFDTKFDPTWEKGDPVYKRVTVEGYLDIPRGMFVVSGATGDVVLWATADRSGKSITMYLKVGEGANQVSEYPDHYKDSDLKVHTADGKTLGVGAKVRVTASRGGSASDGTCSLTAIEAIKEL